MKGSWIVYWGISYFVKKLKYNTTSEGILPNCKSLALRRVTQSHSHLRCTNSSINLCTLVWLPYHTVGQLYIAMQVWKRIQKSQGTLVNCSRHSQLTNVPCDFESFFILAWLYIGHALFFFQPMPCGTLVNCSRHSLCTVLRLSNEGQTKVFPDLSWTVRHKSYISVHLQM